MINAMEHMILPTLKPYILEHLPPRTSTPTARTHKVKKQQSRRIHLTSAYVLYSWRCFNKINLEKGTEVAGVSALSQHIHSFQTLNF